MASQPFVPAQALRQPSKDTSLSDAPTPLPTEPGSSTKEADEQSRRHCMMLRGTGTMVAGFGSGVNVGGCTGVNVGGLLGTIVAGLAGAIADGGAGAGAAGAIIGGGAGAGIAGAIVGEAGGGAGSAGAGCCATGTSLRTDVVVGGHATLSCLQHHCFLFWGQEEIDMYGLTMQQPIA